jgi:hypothetical protein
MVIEEKLLRLEIQMRRLKLILVLSSLVIGVVLLAGAQPTNTVIQAKRFEVINPDGIVMATFGLDDGWPWPKLNLKSRDNGRAWIAAGSNGEYVMEIQAKDGKSEAIMYEDPGSPHRVFIVVTKDGKEIWKSP